MYKGKNPDMDNYKKLLHMMQYLRATKDLILMIELDKHPNWWVDSSNAENLDMHGHSGIYMTLGKGVTYSRSKLQKRNTKSSWKRNLWPSMMQWGRYY